MISVLFTIFWLQPFNPHINLGPSVQCVIHNNNNTHHKIKHNIRHSTENGDEIFKKLFKLYKMQLIAMELC